MSEAPAPIPNDEGLRLSKLGLAVGVLDSVPQLLVPVVAALAGARSQGLAALIIIPIALGLAFLVRLMRWQAFQYFLGEDDIRIEQGLLGRTMRSIPYDRIHDVGIHQKPVVRLLGLAEVEFETGSGTGDEGKLSYVTLAEAQRLRELVRAHRSGKAPACEAAGADDEGQLLYAMSLPRVLNLGLYSFSLLILVVLFELARQLDFLLPFGRKELVGFALDEGISLSEAGLGGQAAWLVVVLAVLIAIGMVSGMVRAVLTNYNFRLEQTPRGLRRRRGLLTLTDVTLPLARIQGALIASGPLREARGWYKLELMSLASDGESEGHHQAAPLARFDEIAPILACAGLALPDGLPAFTRPAGRLWLLRWLLGVTVLAGLGGAVWLAGVEPKWPAVFAVAALLALGSWLAWQKSGYAMGDDRLHTRRGWWRRRISLARQINVQSVGLRQGPIERLAGVARIHFGIPGGELVFAAVPLAEARTIRTAVIALVAPIDFAQLGRGALPAAD